MRAAGFAMVALGAARFAEVFLVFLGMAKCWRVRRSAEVVRAYGAVPGGGDTPPPGTLHPMELLMGWRAKRSAGLTETRWLSL